MNVPTLRTLTVAGLTVTLAVTLAACGADATPAPVTGVPKPAPVTAGTGSAALPQGKESMYELLNVGTIADADALLADTWNLPRFPPAELGGLPSWREDPYGDTYWRFLFYSLRPTSNLLWAYYTSGQAKYRDKLHAILRSYTEYDAQDLPPARKSMDEPHAIAFRAMVLTNSYVKLHRTGDLPPDLSTAVERSIKRVGDELLLPENYQADHNHAFTQAAALLLLHANFPQADPAGDWGRVGQARMTELLTRIIDVDGVQVEKSPFYHFYVLNFALQLQQWAARSGWELPAGYAERVKAMVRFATEIIWPNGEIPLIGSSVKLRPEGESALYADLLRDNPAFRFAVTAGREGTAPADRAILFPQSGHAVLRSPIGQAAASKDPSKGRYRDNSQLVMDVGPPRTAHAHPEALGLSYYSQGRELLVDSGLYTYDEQRGRNYFFGTAAHNTVLVDGADQQPGPVTAALTAAGDRWAYQSGWSQVNPGVTHRRAVLLLDRDLVLVADTLTSAAPHRYEQLWHLFPGARTTTDGARLRAFDEHDNPAVRIEQSAGGSPAQLRTYYGQNDPQQGWHSDEYGRMEPNHVGGWTVEGQDATYLTLIASGPRAGETPAAGPGAAVRGGIGDVRAAEGGTVTATVCAGDRAANIVITNLAGRGETVGVEWTGKCADA